LPATPEVIAAFGSPPKGSHIPLGRLSVLYDVLNTVVVEADLVSTEVGERVLAGEHLAATRVDDLVLMIVATRPFGCSRSMPWSNGISACACRSPSPIRPC